MSQYDYITIVYSISLHFNSQAVFGNGGSFLDCITTESIHKGAKPAWGEYYNLLDTVAYEDQKLKANGIHVLRELSKYNRIYLIGT